MGCQAAGSQLSVNCGRRWPFADVASTMPKNEAYTAAKTASVSALPSDLEKNSRDAMLAISRPVTIR